MGVGAIPAGALKEEAAIKSLIDLAEAVQEGAGLPAITRAAAKVLGASLALVDRSATVLAISALSPDEENKLRTRRSGVSSYSLRVDGEEVGELRIRPRKDSPKAAVPMELITALLALEIERQRAGDWAEEDAAADLVRRILARELTAEDEINSAMLELGTDLSPGCGVVQGRLRPEGKPDKDWISRAHSAALRGLRAVSRGALASMDPNERIEGAYELRAILPVEDTRDLDKAAMSAASELTSALPDVKHCFGASRRFTRANDLFRAGREALLALNVGEAEGMDFLAIEETGSYRLLLAGMSEDPSELQWFYEDTVAPIIAYDEQYGTDLLATVEAFLRNDGNIGPTAEELFTHRHTIRYRLGRVRDLCGYDIQSTDGRERLGFGIKVMRVLGLGPRGHD
jgi:hypothetical protein